MSDTPETPIDAPAPDLTEVEQADTIPFEDEKFVPEDDPAELDPEPQTHDVLLQQDAPSLTDVRRSIFGLFIKHGGGNTDAQIVAGRTIFAQKAVDPGTIEHALSVLENYYSDEANRALEFLKANPDLATDPNFGRRLRENGKPNSTLGPVGVAPKKRSAEPLTGNEAIATFEATRRGGMTNVMLYNSGISVTLRQPTLSEVYSLITRCRALFTEFGGVLGASYFLMDDYLIKQQVMAFVLPLIMDCSLKGWRAEGTLYQVFSLNDIQTVLMEIAILMYPKSYKDFVTVCPPSVDGIKAGCGHVSRIEIDLRELVKVRFSRMSQDSIRFMAQTRDTAKKRHTVEEVLAYQEGLGFSGTVSSGDRLFYMSVPTLKTYFEASDQIFADTLADMQAAQEKDKAGVIASRSFMYYLPWVSKVEQLADASNPNDDPEVVAVTEDRGPVAYLLDRLMDDQDAAEKVVEQILKIIDDSNLTLMAYKSEPCPKCRYRSPDNGGFVAVDPRSAFFTLGEAKLPEIY